MSFESVNANGLVIKFWSGAITQRADFYENVIDFLWRNSMREIFKMLQYRQELRRVVDHTSGVVLLIYLKLSPLQRLRTHLLTICYWQVLVSTLYVFLYIFVRQQINQRVSFWGISFLLLQTELLTCWGENQG